MKTIEFILKRDIPAAPAAVYSAWMDTKHPGNPWHDAEKLIVNPKVNGLFHFRHIDDDGDAHPHYGCFLVIKPSKKVQYTWMSPHTRGLESLVTVTFEKAGKGTLLTLRHEGLPNDQFGRLHDRGWKYFLGIFVEQFAAKSN